MNMVLIHGGGFAASCWDRTLPYLTSPVTSSVLAVDLPGRGAHPADLATVGIEDCAQSVIGDMDAAGIDKAVIVGHSMGGLTLSALARLIPERIERLVFVSCVVPPDGKGASNTSGEEVRDVKEGIDAQDDGKLMSDEVATAVFCNDMDADLTAYTLSIMGPEAPGLVVEPVSLSGFANDIPRTYVKLLDDAILVPEMQDQFIANIGNCEVVTLDCAHMAMISQPERLAEILNGLVF